MLLASSKTREAFYNTMLADAEIQKSLSNVEFGEGAKEFYMKVYKSMHREHLLVLYSVRLLLKVFSARHPSSSADATEE